MRKSLAVSAVIAAILGMTGCAASVAPADDGKVRIVASTNVWGDVARQIGGATVQVDSIISSPDQDPHSYEGDAQVQLALSKADVVIENGGGYDDFVGTLLKGANNSTAKVLNAVDISGFDQHPATGELNEHVWYDFPTVSKVAARIRAELTRLDPASASVYRANEKTFDAALATLEAGEAAIKAGPHAGEGVAITEPVPLYLLSASGLVNRTPAKFSSAIEEGTDVSPELLKQTLELFSEHRVKLLAYNEQTSGPETEAVLAAAKSAGIPVVPVTETLPKGEDYLTWMTRNLAAVTAALK
jgi:zinc/manganese transport system substrate-binding protein